MFHCGPGAFPVCRAPLWPHQCSLGVHKSDVNGCSSPSEVGVPVFPYLNNLLLKAGSSQALVTHLQTTANLLHSLGIHYVYAEVTPDSFSNAPLHRSHSGQGTVPSLCSKEESQGHSGYESDVLASALDFGGLTLRLLGLMPSCILLVKHA